jgi:hypothetical protein
MTNLRSGLLFTALFLLGCSSSPDRTPLTAAAGITAAEAEAQMMYLASDALLGRNTPSPQLDTAAAFIAKVFRSCGLAPVGGSYLQPFNLCFVSLGEPNALSITIGGKRTDYAIKTEFTPFEMTASRSVTAPLVFAGYGITAPEYTYDDYAGIDVRGKIAVVLRHEPGEEDTASVFLGKRATDYSSVARKVQIAKEHGAVALFVITDPLNHESLSPRGFPWPSLTRTIPRDALPLTLGADEEGKIPVIHVGESVVTALFGGVEQLKGLQREIDASLASRSFLIAGAEASVQTTTSIKSNRTNNVVGFLQGSDPVLKNQIVVVGAHYDHVGYKKNAAPGEDSVFNGADDNASGTVALLGVARGLSALPAAPKRSILLIAFAGEEKGLFGSEYYARNPLFRLDSTVAMLNMDMVGRNGADSLELIGVPSAPELGRFAREANADVGFHLWDSSLASGGSDHMSFQKRNVPSLFFHSGLHPDYHKVADNPDRINHAKVAMTARLAFLTAVRLADDSARYRYIPKPISLF